MQFVHKYFNVCREEGVFVYVDIHVNKGHVTVKKLLDFGSIYNQNTKSGAASQNLNTI